MPIERAFAGEDVAVSQNYTDPDTGDPVDPDDTGTDGVPDVSVTITDDAGTEHISAVAMTHNGTGDFEYVWDTDVDSAGTGTYTVETSAEFSGETKIDRDTITLR